MHRGVSERVREALRFSQASVPMSVIFVPRRTEGNEHVRAVYRSFLQVFRLSLSPSPPPAPRRAAVFVAFLAGPVSLISRKTHFHYRDGVTSAATTRPLSAGRAKQRDPFAGTFLIEDRVLAPGRPAKNQRRAVCGLDSFPTTFRRFLSARRAVNIIGGARGSSTVFSIVLYALT